MFQVWFWVINLRIGFSNCPAITKLWGIINHLAVGRREQLAAIWIYGRYEDFRLEANNLCNNEEMHCVKEKIRIIT